MRSQAKPRKATGSGGTKQVHSTWRRSSVPSPFLEDICSSLSSSVVGVDCLFCRFSDPSKSSVTGIGSCFIPAAFASIRGTSVHRDPLASGASHQRSIGLWGMIGRFSWALQDVPLHETTFSCGMEQHDVPVVHTCLCPSKNYFCRYRSELVLLRFGRRWSLSLPSFGLDLILNVGLPVPAAPEFRRWGHVSCFCHHWLLSSLMSRPLVVFCAFST